MSELPINKGQLCLGCPRIDNDRCGSTKEQAPDVLFIAEQPDDKSAGSGTAFRGHGGRIVREAVGFVKAKQRKYEPININYTYSVQCVSPDDTAPNKVVLHTCRPYLLSAIKQQKPKVIVAMGATALRQLGVKQKYNDCRNRFIKHFAYEAPIYVTFSEKALLATPGVFETFKLNIINVFERVLNNETKQVPLEELAKQYLLPKTMDEALAACDEILAYTGSEKRTPESWHISVDTETNTLHPEKETAKIIAFCFGWDTGKATTLLFEHPHAGEEYLRRLPELKEKIKQILASPRPKIFHNAKFDLKFIECKYEMPVNNVAWDTLLGEHLLDEDKKGNYGLKILTANYLPDYCGYEDKLHDLLEAEEGISKVDETERELETLRELVAQEHPDFIKAMEDYKEELQKYENEKTEYDQAMRDYRLGLDDYTFCKEYLAGLQAVWQVEVRDWPKGKRGKPKKPVKWFKKESKPPVLKEPKRPKDPRTKKEKQISSDAGFENIPVHDLQVYGAVDGDVTRQLANNQFKRILTEKSKVRTLMSTHAVPASRVLGRMEFGGTRVDADYVEVLDDALTKIVAETERELYQMSGRKAPNGKDINLNGAATLANVLYNWGWTHPNGKRMEPYEVLAYTKKKQPSTSEKILRQFIDYEDEDKKVPTEEAYFVERLCRYRKASKAKNTFLANIRALSKRDGYLHTQFHLNGTGTGRLSSSDMNMQNIPKYLAGWNLKKLFVPDCDDYVICNVDYKGAEVRVFTAYAHDKALIQALNEGLDMHSFFASKVFKRDYEMYARREDPVFIPDAELRKTLDKERSRIKRVVFGILYGAGPDKIAETIGIDPEEAKLLIALLYAMFPEIQRYAEIVEHEVVFNQYVETHFGRRRRFPLARIPRHAGRAKRQARNFKIQSTSSDIVISQMIEMDEILRNDFHGRMLLTVHDSVVFQFPKKYIFQLEDFVTRIAEDRVREKFPWLPVPFKADIEVGDNYGECQSIQRYTAKHSILPPREGIIEENELLTELRNAAFEAA